MPTHEAAQRRSAGIRAGHAGSRGIGKDSVPRHRNAHPPPHRVPISITPDERLSPSGSFVSAEPHVGCDMIGRVSGDLVLWFVVACASGVTLVLEVPRVDRRDRAGSPAGSEFQRARSPTVNCRLISKLPSAPVGHDAVGTHRPRRAPLPQHVRCRGTVVHQMHDRPSPGGQSARDQQAVTASRHRRAAHDCDAPVRGEIGEVRETRLETRE